MNFAVTVRCDKPRLERKKQKVRAKTKKRNKPPSGCNVFVFVFLLGRTNTEVLEVNTRAEYLLATREPRLRCRVRRKEEEPKNERAARPAEPAAQLAARPLRLALGRSAFFRPGVLRRRAPSAHAAPMCSGCSRRV